MKSLVFLITLSVSLLAGCTSASNKKTGSSSQVSPSATTQPSTSNNDAGTNSVAPLQPQGIIPDGDYRIAAVGTNKCLAPAKNRRMILYECGQSSPQKYRFTVNSTDNFYTIRAVRDDGHVYGCLDVARNEYDEDQVLELDGCTDEAISFQKWYVEPSDNGWYVISNVKSQKCMAPRDRSGGNDLWIVQNDCGRVRTWAKWQLVRF